MRRSLLATGLLAIVLVIPVFLTTRAAGLPDGPEQAGAARASAPAPTVTLVPTSGPTAAPAPAAIPVRDHALLRAHLEQLIGMSRLDRGQIAVVVLDGNGAEVVADEPNRLLLPASTAKLVTAAAALSTFGPDHRFTTRALGTTPVSGRVLAGDLVLVGGGDPVLATPAYGSHVYPVRPRTPLEDLADAIAASGVRRIMGDLVAVDPLMAGATMPSGWPDRYLADFDARRITGLTVDAGLDIRREDRLRRRAVEIQDGTSPDLVRIEQSEDPVAAAGTALRQLLRERRVRVMGEVVARTGPVPTNARYRLGSVQSPPLAALLRHTVERSDNQLADSLFRVVGAAEGAPTWRGAAKVVTRELRSMGVRGGLDLVDGSGLSRDDRASAAVLAALNHQLTAGPHHAMWLDLLAIAGEEGTLRHRLRWTPAAGRVFGKSGTLDDVRALVATVVGAGGRYQLVVVGNDLRGGDIDRVRALTDALALTLVADLDGCLTTPPAAPPSPAPSPAAIVPPVCPAA